jgi:hypothetical protein
MGESAWVERSNPVAGPSQEYSSRALGGGVGAAGTRMDMLASAAGPTGSAPVIDSSPAAIGVVLGSAALIWVTRTSLYKKQCRGY